jgi:hypothetical protein
MPPTMTKILGIAAIALFCAAIGAVGGIVMSYIISTSKPQYHFNYGLAFIIGIAGGTYGLINAIREVWFR